MQQGLAGVCVPHLGQFAQVTQLKTTSLGILKDERTTNTLRLKTVLRMHGIKVTDHTALTLHPFRKLPIASTVARIHLKVWLADSCSMASFRWKRGSAISW